MCSGDRGQSQEKSNSEAGINATDFIWKNNEQYSDYFFYFLQTMKCHKLHYDDNVIRYTEKNSQQ